MVRQNWNHPSIVFWSSGNETYEQVASHYADIIRQEDDTRLITYASAGEKPENVDFVAGNTYQAVGTDADLSNATLLDEDLQTAFDAFYAVYGIDISP